ncbi:hypothetical protein Lepto7375DRAFT_5442 [Leptolyngbya sp. PCC 7375]|nr:hypothetical protein Lepto7375DRAFT_5442 [Leptolyngbya sp. PCC 7375]
MLSHSAFLVFEIWQSAPPTLPSQVVDYMDMETHTFTVMADDR